MQINDDELKELLDQVYVHLNDRTLMNALELQERANEKWPDLNEEEFEWIEKGYSMGVADGIRVFGESFKEAMKEIKNKHDI